MRVRTVHALGVGILILLLAMQATLTLSPFLTQKLNKLGSDLYGANGQQNTPRTTADFIDRLKNIFACKSPP